MKTKQEIFEYFDGKISKVAIKLIDDEYQVVGKWCRVALDENGEIDLFLCNTRDLRAGLSERRLTNKICGLFGTGNSPLIRLSGEAHGKVQDKAVILDNLDLLGIRRKRTISEKQRQASIARFKASRRWARQKPMLSGLMPDSEG